MIIFMIIFYHYYLFPALHNHCKAVLDRGKNSSILSNTAGATLTTEGNNNDLCLVCADGISATDKLYNNTLVTSNPCKKPVTVPRILSIKPVPELIFAIYRASQTEAP